MRVAFFYTDDFRERTSSLVSSRESPGCMDSN